MTRLRIAAFGTAVASAAALMSLPAGQAQAEVITMSVEVGAGPVVDLATFGGVGTANGYVMDSASIAALDGFLFVQKSLYDVAAIGGTSNFPGSTRGLLTLDGLVFSIPTGGVPSLTITETEDGFTSPPPYSLTSSSTGSFVNQPSGGGHTASSSFNGASTPTYSVLSDGIGTNAQANMATLDDLSPVTPYTVSNTIIFGLAPGTATSPITDEFSVSGTVIPEPSTWAMMLLGFAGLAFSGYRQARAGHATLAR